MWCVAICHDIQGGAATRSALFQAHVEHNIARMSAFLLTAPIANGDGSTGIGDDPRLIGSIYCLDVENLAAARGVMETDPFMHDVWGRIDYYEWRARSGVWFDESKRPKGLSPAYRCYAAASRAPLLLEGALMDGELEYLMSSGGRGSPFASLALVRADTIEGARALADGAEWIAALPIAIGRWVGISSPADLPKATT